MSPRLALIPCLASALFFGACDGDKTTGSSSDAKSVLVSAKWKMTGNEIAPAVDLMDDGVWVTDLFHAGNGASCTHDDITTFAANGTYSVDAGAVKCAMETSQTETGTWQLNAAQDVLTMVSDLEGYQTTQKIAGATASTLRLQSPDDGWGDGKTHTVTLTFTAQ